MNKQKDTLTKTVQLGPDQLATPGVTATVHLTFHESRKRVNTVIRAKRTLNAGRGKTATFKSEHRTIPSFLQAIILPEHHFLVQRYIDEQRKTFAFDCRQRLGLLPQTNPAIKNQACATPPEVYRFLQDEMGLSLSTFDPCPLNHTECGLAKEWPVIPAEQTLFINPPYNACEVWIRKTLEHLERGKVSKVVMLLPSRMYPRWFTDLVVGKATAVMTISGGVKFVGFDRVFPWGNMFVVFDHPDGTGLKPDVATRLVTCRIYPRKTSSTKRKRERTAVDHNMSSDESVSSPAWKVGGGDTGRGD
jgi:hypothetical protein